MLPVMLMVVALLLIASATLAVGTGARRSSSDARDHAQALALAELGLERTRAYLVRLSAVDLDFDRALDPNLDSACTVAGQVTVTSGGADDSLPPFSGPGVGVVDAGAAGRTWMLVPYGDGAYMVRIDDNQDDLAGTYVAGTNNNSGAGCVEGASLGAAEQNPVRDRDRTVVITAVGIYPGTNPATARATRTLRAAVGPAKAAGIIAGGSVDMGGASKACGEFADLSTTGTMVDGCMCHAGCNGGPPSNQCGTLGAATCNVSAAGGCGSTSMGSGTCTGGAAVSPPPKVAPFDPTNGPAPCSSDAGVCTPYYYLRHQAGVATRVYQWNYGGAGCQNPRGFLRLCHPTDGAPLAACAACWTQVYANPVAPYEVTLVDDATRLALSPGAADAGGPTIWDVTAGAATLTPSCSATDGGTDYPPPGTGFGLGVEEVPGTTFRLQAAPPRGVWLVEGNMDTGGLTTGACPGDGLPRSLNVVGSVIHETNDLTLVPAAPKGYVLLAGRDLKMITGNTVLSTCGTGAAVMVHEQFWADANIHLEAQLIVEHRAACSTTVNTAEAIYTRGNMTIHVSGFPQVETGAPATPFLWSESAL
jgi:hypothetical protein